MEQLHPESPYGYCYDYTKCMMMKLLLADPDRKGGSTVHMTFEQALEAMKAIDAITQGIKKIYYLVGWQYNGHDDKYPDFFEVNQALKRPQDATALDSFLWLTEQAKQYHSVVSIHMNLNDAYDDAPSFHDFVSANALIRGKNGRPKAIEKYNGRLCYKTSLKEYWESGLFHKQVDRLLRLLPLEEAHTVHIDNFQCYHNTCPTVTIKEMQDYRKKMIAYFREKGIDITSEFTYKEDESLPNKKLFGLPREHHPNQPMDTLGLIPASWWCTRMTRAEYVDIPPQLYGGGMYKDKRYARYLYGNMHGETIIKPSNPQWTQDFLHTFATLQVPYHYLCQSKRLAITGNGQNEKCVFENNLVSYCKKQRIVAGACVLKEQDTLLLPIVQKQGHWLAYSKQSDSRTWQMPGVGDCMAKIYRITPEGNRFLEERQITGGSLPLSMAPGEGLLIVL